MLHLHHANRHEALRERLLAHLAATRGVFAAEPVIVPNAAHRRTLSLALADQAGICAQVPFAYLAQWLWQQVARLVPQVGPHSPFDAATLTWRVWAIFGDAGFVAGHPRLAHWLAAGDARARYELAARAAQLLEQYVTWRGDWLQAWRDGQPVEGLAGPDQDWQAALWRRLGDEMALQAAHPRQAFAAALRRDGAKLVTRGVLPARVHVFGLPAIAPLHLQMLQQLAAHLEVHLYVPNPCADYWFEVVSERRLRRLALRGQAQAHEVGNRWLASWGRQAQAQLQALAELEGEGVSEDEDYRPAPGPHLLATVQNAVLTLNDLAPGSVRLDEADRSIELHVCHSLGRELEVLQDTLLGLFASLPGLRASDVLVVTPDLEAAAPRIDALFGTAPADRQVAYTLAARPRSRANLPARALLDVLALVASRAPATALFGLLQEPVVARRFGLDEAALGQVRDGLLAAGLRWGLDDAHLRALGLPPQAHTLAAACSRLFLGHALPDATDAPFAGLLPAGGIEGSATEVLGALWQATRQLQRLREQLATPARPAAWAERLHAVLDDFVLADEGELDDLRELRVAIATLATQWQQSGLGDALPLAVVRQALQQVLDDHVQGGMPGGGVTFASMSSLRGLPYRVVCAIGLDAEAFPRSARPDELDLMALKPRRGDRVAGDEDRGLMLDLLLAARDRLYLSYTGRSARDNTPLPPSGLVDELIEPLIKAVAADADDPGALQTARRRLVIEHPLQPFSPRAFEPGGDPRVLSHDGDLAAALRHGLQSAAPTMPLPAAGAPDDDDAEDDDVDREAETQQPFFTAALAPPSPELRIVTLEQLVNFFRNPCRELLRRRLGVALPRGDDELQDDEALVAGRAERRALAARLLPALLRGADEATAWALARAGTEAPAGALGAQWLQGEFQALRAFAQRVQDACAAPTQPPQAVALTLDLDGEPWTLRATFSELRESGIVGWRYDELRAGERLQAWLQHLLLCATAPLGVLAQTRWLAIDDELCFQACTDARQRLTDLLRLVRRGLAEPLHFFPRSAWDLVSQGPVHARTTWTGGHGLAGERDDPAYALALRGTADPLDADFEALAHAVYGPLRSALAAEPR